MEYSLHHVTVLVSDLERALDFYCDTLGLEQDSSRPDLGYPGAWLKVGTQQIHLMQLPNPDAGNERPVHGGRDRHFALTISDMSLVSQQLDKAKVAYTMSRSGRRALFCRDPDENAIEIVEAP